MIRRLYRHRRRILFLMVMIAASSTIHALANYDLRYVLKHEFTGPLWITGVSVVLAVTIMTMAIAVPVLVLFPAARRTLEVVGLTLLISTGLSPFQSLLPLWAQTGTASWIAFFAVYLSVCLLLEGAMLFRLGLRLPYRATVVRIIAASPEAIWAAIAPDTDTVGTYWTGTLLKVQTRPDLGASVVEARYRLGPSGTLIQLQTRRIWDKPLHLVYDFVPEDARGGANIVKGTFEMRCEVLDDGRTRVSVRHCYPVLSLGMASLLWFDDMVACEMDAVSARIRGKRDRSITGWSARKMAA